MKFKGWQSVLAGFVFVWAFLITIFLANSWYFISALSIEPAPLWCSKLIQSHPLSVLDEIELRKRIKGAAEYRTVKYFREEPLLQFCLGSGLALAAFIQFFQIPARSKTSDC